MDRPRYSHNRLGGKEITDPNAQKDSFTISIPPPPHTHTHLAACREGWNKELQGTVFKKVPERKRHGSISIRIFLEVTESHTMAGKGFIGYLFFVIFGSHSVTVVSLELIAQPKWPQIHSMCRYPV